MLQFVSLFYRLHFSTLSGCLESLICVCVFARRARLQAVFAETLHFVQQLTELSDRLIRVRACLCVCMKRVDLLVCLYACGCKGCLCSPISPEFVWLCTLFVCVNCGWVNIYAVLPACQLPVSVSVVVCIFVCEG